MTTVMQLISQLGEAGIKVWLDDDRQLRFKAPKGALTSELKEQLLAQKDNVITFLQHSQTGSGNAITPAERNPAQLYPLSFAQQRFWFLDRLEPGNPSLHIAAALRITGALDIESLRLSFEHLVARHESLRTSFIYTNNQPLQKIHAPMQWQLHENYDLSHLRADEQHLHLQDIMAEEALRPFDLHKTDESSASLLRTKLARLSPEHAAKPVHVLFISLHHIIADGWSLNILIKDLVWHYQCLQNKSVITRDSLGLAYIDFAHWQHQWIGSPAQQQQLHYWQEQLKGSALLQLPTDFPRPKQTTHHGSSVRFSIPASISAQLKILAVEQQVSVFIVLLAAFNVLLHRYTGQDDICIGTPVAGRGQQALENIIGCFINLLAIRNTVDSNMAFSDFVVQVKNTLLAAQEHQDIPFELVAEACTNYRSLAHTPIFQVLFTHQASNPHGQLHVDQLELELLPQPSLTAKYDIQLHINNDADNFSGIIEYNTNLFLEETITGISRHYCNLLESICTNSDAALKNLAILDNIDLRQLIPANTAINYNNTDLVQQFNQAMVLHGNNIAVRCAEDSITYHQLDELANAVANLLIKNGVKPADRVGLCFNPGIDFMIALLGSIKCGATYVPMDINYPAERLLHMAHNADMAALLTGNNIGHTFPGMPNVITISSATLHAIPSAPLVNIDPEQIFYIIYTSGSTGLPKGACVSHRNESNLLNWYIRQYNMNASDKVMVISALGFDLTQKNLLAPLLCGAEVVFSPSHHYDPQLIMETVQTQNITWLNCAPSAFYPLVEICARQQRIERLSSLRHVLFGGEPILLENLRSWITHSAFHARITNMYGPTECTDITCVHTLENPLDYIGRNIPIGQCINGVEIYILDQHRQLLPIGASGELYIGGISVGNGYFNNTAMTAASFSDNPFTTGKMYRTRDIVRQVKTPQGLQLEFLSRSDDQVKIRGFRVELGEVASQLMQLSSIKEALVISNKDDNGVQKLLAYYTSHTGHAIDLSALREHLKARLPDYMIPGAFVDIKEWPLSANGKIDKKALPKPLDAHTLKAVYIAPHTLIEKQLADCWQQTLKIDNIGIHDNFFELGGHSLIATQLAGSISQELGVELPLKVFFEKPTIAELATEIEQGNYFHTLSSMIDITPHDRTSPIPLSFAQERLWIIEQLSPGNTAYHIPFALQLNGNLDKPALVQAIHALVARHESLRTMIKTGADGMAFQHIRPASEFRLSESVITQQELADHIASMANTPFDFATELLFRIEIASISATEHALLGCMHHIIADGWSMGILQDDLQAFYRHFALHDDTMLPDMHIQYADFTAWQRSPAMLEKSREHLHYWVKQLENIPPHINLPLDKPRPSQQSFNGAMFTGPLPHTLATQVSTFSKGTGTTTFTVLLAAFALLLQKYAKQEDICIGTPVSGRENSSLQNIIGYFVNAVVIRNNLTGNPDFFELVKRTGETSIAAFAHQDVAIEQVLDRLNLQRNPAYSPVAQVGFSFIGNMFTREFSTGQLKIDTLPINQIVAKYDLTLIVIETGKGMEINLEYNTDLFHHESIARMHRHYIHLLEQCLATPDISVGNLSLLSSEELIDALQLDAEKIEDILPLTAMQHDMVLSQWLNPKSLANTLGYRAEVEFEVDAHLWDQAIKLVALQQPVTRTHFKTNRFAYGDFAFQCIYRDAHVVLDVMDYRNELLTEVEIQDRVDAFIYQPEQYTQDKFIRYGLMQVSSQRTILLMSAHHALLDGISIVIIAGLTARYYEALAHHHPVINVDTPPLAFGHYIEKNRQLMDKGDTLKFWQERFRNCEATDFLSTLTELPNRQIVKVHYLDNTLWQQIKSFCRQQRTTPAYFLKLVYSLLIANYCRTTADFYISEFHAGRSRDNAIALGCYFEHSPFIFAHELLQKHTGFSELLHYARDYRKAIKPFDFLSMGLCNRLAPQGRLHFMFNYYHFFPQNQCLMDHPITCIETPPFIERTVQFVVKEHEETCQLDLYYQTHSFQDLQFLERMELLCQQIVNGIHCIGDLSLLLPNEIIQQKELWNNTRRSLPHYQSVHEWFEDQVTITPSNIAITDDHGTITYRELNEKANRIAHFLQTQGVGSDVRVGLCMHRNIDAICIILGIMKAGGAYVPVDANYPPQRIRYMLDTAKIHILFTQDSLKHLFTDFSGTLVCINNDSVSTRLINQAPDTNPLHANRQQDMLYVIFTSGSTGNPKGATVTHLGEINLLHWYTQEFAFNEKSSTLIISALGFDLTQKNLFAPLVTGGKLVLSQLEHYDSGVIHDLIGRHRITHINCAPSAFYPLVEDHTDYQALNSLRFIIFGGENIKCQKLARWFHSSHCFAQLVNNYGPTECTDIATFFQVSTIDDYFDRPIPIGKPNYNVEVFLLNSLQQLLPAGLTGEICITGTGVGRGYLNNEDLNLEKFIPNPFGEGQMYRTGDLGKYLPDGNIEFQTRQDFQLKLNGLRIEPGEIEHTIRRQLKVADSLVTVIDNQLAAYAIADKDYVLDQDWKQQLEHTLPGYMVPQSLSILMQWPLTPNGKIDRSALPSPDKSTNNVPYVAPRDEIEKVICDIVQRILNIDQVGVLDNFFDLGGHSLSASRAIVQLREHFQIDIPLNVLFEMTTVEKMAAYIKASQWALESATNHQEDSDNRDTGFI